MTAVRLYRDTIVIGLGRYRPVTADLERLTAVARDTLAAGYPRSTLIEVDWTFATTIEQVEAWPLPHDCDNCRDGKTKAIAVLTTQPGTVVALGGMLCEEPA